MGIFFRYLNSVAVLILVSVHLLGATEENELYQELRDALLTEDNIFRLQQAFYPSGSTIISLPLYVTVGSITDSKFSPCSAFSFHNDCWCFQRGFNHSYDIIQISSYPNNLEAYLRPYINAYVISFDITFFKLLTSVGYERGSNYDGDNSKILNINMKNLTTNPTESTYIKTLQMLFHWARYYARVGNMSKLFPKLESDRSTASLETFNDRCHSSHESFHDLHVVSLLGIAYTAHFFIMLFGLYALNLTTIDHHVIKKIKSLLAFKIMHTLILSTFTTLMAINISFFICELYYNIIEVKITFVLTYFFLLIEVCVIVFYFSKHIKLNTYLCSLSKPLFIRAVNSILLATIMCFIHRVWNIFFVSIYFIAVAPAPTLATIALCISVTLIVILAIASISHTCCYSDSKNCAKILRILLLLLMISSLTSMLVFLTLIFVVFTINGLSATSIGSIILSLTIPLIMFCISLFAKRYLEEARSSESKDSLPINDHQDSRENHPLLGDNNV